MAFVIAEGIVLAVLILAGGCALLYALVWLLALIWNGGIGYRPYIASPRQQLKVWQVLVLCAGGLCPIIWVVALKLM